MKIFEKDNKTNFVDDNNVFVGFDTYGQCCEDYGWFISKEPKTKISDDEYSLDELSEYSFNTNYFEDVPAEENDDSGGMVRFCLVHPTGKELFLHLYNFHNGYYGHGFESKIGGIDWESGSL